MVLAVDVASGEKPIEELVLGAIQSLSKSRDIDLILVGNEKNIVSTLSKSKYNKNRIDVVHTNYIIDMDESPSVGIKNKKMPLFY